MASSVFQRRLVHALGGNFRCNNHLGSGPVSFRRFLATSTTTTNYDAPVSGLDDGSESTLGQDGKYTGSWDSSAARPHGKGKMVWNNGISYHGDWHNGKFHGIGAKLYSRGGGYEGEWVEGKRQGRGAMIFGGKFGYERWDGPFVKDQPHGVGVMTFPNGSKDENFEFAMGKPKSTADNADEKEKHFDGHISNLDDGSPSTIGIAGHYSGSWDEETARPHGFGVMKWDNGIEYKGVWKNGLYNGHGRKLYSHGGGYEGMWVNGRREGHGVTFFVDGKSLGRHGILRWEGTFVNDKPHGSGQAYVAAEKEDTHGRWSGDTAIKGPMIEFVNGEPVNLP